VRRIAGAVLAGGKSSRFGGFPKGTLRRPDGRSVVGHLLTVLNEAGVAEAVIVANPPHPYGEAGCAVIPDIRPGLGPLGGIEAALCHFRASHDALFLLPCDLPGLGVAQIDTLRQAYETTGEPLVVAETGAPPRMEPLCAIVDMALFDSIAREITKGARSVKSLWVELSAHRVRFADASAFCNVNAAEDWSAWCRRGGAGWRG
jgi:molybdopterin-guanine dinucleotide biosynthesis protein A